MSDAFAPRTEYNKSGCPKKYLVLFRFRAITRYYNLTIHGFVMAGVLCYAFPSSLTHLARWLLMRPTNLKTGIFLDSGDPAETKKALALLGFLDGQTTNPSLFAKNPEVQAKLARGERFRREEILGSYRQTIQGISALIPAGSVSVEVYADRTTTADEMIAQSEQMFAWIPNAHIKLPIGPEGVKAMVRCVARGLRVNMTLCFSQSQAAAIHLAAQGAKRGDIFISPFVGRLDDRGIDGMSLIRNILRMYREASSQVEVLTASVRNIDHLLCAIALGSDIVTAPLKVLDEWARKGMTIPGPEYQYDAQGWEEIPYEHLDPASGTHTLDHSLTLAGVDKFAADWNALIA